jgi:hypothetical protein
MTNYTIEEKLTVWLTLRTKGIPSELINMIWKKMLSEKTNDAMLEPPSAPKKQISNRTRNMMERWHMNGIWERHVRNIQFEEIDSIYIQN